MTHEATKFDMDAPAWVACANFSIGAKSPTLNAINADWDAGRGVMTLTHPDYPPLVFRPDDTEEHARFIDWVSPMVPANRAAPRFFFFFFFRFFFFFFFSFFFFFFREKRGGGKGGGAGGFIHGTLAWQSVV